MASAVLENIFFKSAIRSFDRSFFMLLTFPILCFHHAPIFLTKQGFTFREALKKGRGYSYKLLFCCQFQIQIQIVDDPVQYRTALDDICIVIGQRC